MKDEFKSMEILNKNHSNDNCRSFLQTAFLSNFLSGPLYDGILYGTKKNKLNEVVNKNGSGVFDSLCSYSDGTLFKKAYNNVTLQSSDIILVYQGYYSTERPWNESSKKYMA